MNFFETVETDVVEAVHVLEADADAALIAIWNVAKPVFLAAEPTAIAAVLTGLTAFLKTAAADVVTGEFSDIEQAFLMDAEVAGKGLLSVAQGLGSNLLQVLIGLAKGALPAA